MAREDDQDPSWARQLLIGSIVLVAVALVIGAVVSLVALGAARVSGINEKRPAASQGPSLFMPSDVPTTTPEPFPDPDGAASTAVPSPGLPSATPKKRAMSLRASPKQVSSFERIDLTGVYRGGDGTRLQVQRFEDGGWVDFPVSALVTGGRFTTFVLSGRPGTNRFRVLDQVSGTKSNVVRVTIG